MKTVINFSLGAMSVMAALSPLHASAHGWADFPAARQVICESDGGHWGPSDGSQIPNEACRAAFMESGTYPLVQKNEFAALVKDYHNMDAVKAAVPDGTICSGGDPRKSGMSVASEHWQRTDMKAGETFTLRYRATAPHNPSFWQFYLTKPGYNAAHSRIGWDDLELIDTAGNVEVTQEGNGQYYLIDVTLPSGRSGAATLVSRWQRDDPAGEGFYNCSDIRFDGEVLPPEWTTKGQYVKPGVEAQDGDSVWFRIFNKQGSEIVFEKLPITGANENINTWSYDLAQLINENYPTVTQVGVEEASGDIVYQPSDLYTNQVFVTNPDYNYALDVRDGDVIEPAPVTVQGLESEYTQGSDGKTHIDATVSSEGRYLINMKLLDSTGHQLALASDIVDNGNIDLSVLTTETGSFSVVVTAAEQGSSDHQVVENKSIIIKDSSGGGDYDYAYPDGIGSYVPGETVVLSRDGNTYQCRPFPEGGWCNIDSAHHYEPGFGSAWQDAWIKQ
ncbi:lytic polysaccharide monooxygenase [Photobacterium rosenbergii]|uniref:Lytic polysaccharide monooxygenase n=1 Tax=Photobacterium rosenbergii TaxID=294936 RepID=A0ABU3ZH77_9GAMM|nr:lytic polysaccharide monooxygenase [Photobacterium rosenbergii]MDV5169477.1 lytic polysaccharide monooxygenase [Photobacterium rosenbergii]